MTGPLVPSVLVGTADFPAALVLDHSTQPIPDQAAANIQGYVLPGLETLAGALGAGLTLTSVYRDQASNEAAGGSPDSAHMSGLAADVVVPSMTVNELAGALLALQQSGQLAGYDQVILYPDAHLHVGFATGAPRGELEYSPAQAQYERLADAFPALAPTPLATAVALPDPVTLAVLVVVGLATALLVAAMLRLSHRRSA